MSTIDSDSGSASFPKTARLRRPGEFREVYRAGEKRVSPSFVAFILSSNSPHRRFGLTTPRKLGKAHERNRIRRRVREILRRDFGGFPAGRDVVLNPRRAVLTRDWKGLRLELKTLLDHS